MYVCMHVRTYVRMCVCMHVGTMYVHIDTMCVCMYVYMHVCYNIVAPKIKILASTFKQKLYSGTSLPK